MDRDDGCWSAPFRSQRAVSQVSRKQVATEPIGCDSGPSVLGVYLGSDGVGSGDPDSRRDEDYLRSRRIHAAVRSMAGRVRRLEIAGQLFQANRRRLMFRNLNLGKRHVTGGVEFPEPEIE